MRLGVLLMVLLVPVCGLGQTVEYFKQADGSIRLWLEGAPEVTAKPSGGWALAPADVIKDPKWKARLPEDAAGRPWAAFLDSLTKGAPPNFARELKTLANVFVRRRESPEAVRVTATNRLDSSVSASFEKGANGWRSKDANVLDFWLQHEAKVKPQTLATALRDGAPNEQTPWHALIEKSLALDEQRSVRIAGAGVLNVEVLDEAAYQARVSPAKVPEQPKEEEGDAPAFPLALVLGTGVAALGAGFAVAQIPAVKSKLPSRRPSEPAHSGPLPQDTLLANALRDEMQEQRNLGHTQEEDPKRWLRALMSQTASRESELVRTRAQLETLEATHEETVRASKEYRDQHSDWLRDRNSTLARLQQAQSDIALLRATETANKELQEAMQQRVYDLNQEIGSLKQRGDQLASRAKAYSMLHSEAAAAYNLIQSEVARVDVAAVIGYLLNYSVAQLLSTLLAPNPALEAAMLSNIETLACNVSDMAHCKKLASSAKALREGISRQPVQESDQPHDDARHIGALLRFARDQKNLQLSPFYIGVDGQGRAYTVSVSL